MELFRMSDGRNSLTRLLCIALTTALCCGSSSSLATFPESSCESVPLEAGGGVQTLMASTSEAHSIQGDRTVFCWSLTAAAAGTQIRAAFRSVETFPGEVRLDAVELGSAVGDPLSPGPVSPSAMLAPFAGLVLVASIPRSSNASFIADVEAVGLTETMTCGPTEHLCQRGASFCISDDVSCLCLWNPAADCGIQSHSNGCSSVSLSSSVSSLTIDIKAGEWAWSHLSQTNSTCWTVSSSYGKVIQVTFPSSVPDRFRITATQPDVVDSIISILDGDVFPNTVISRRSGLTIVLGLYENHTADTNYRFLVEIVNSSDTGCKPGEFACTESSYTVCFDGPLGCSNEQLCEPGAHADYAMTGLCGPETICLNGSHPSTIHFQLLPQSQTSDVEPCTWWIYAAADQYISIRFDRFEPYASRAGTSLDIGVPGDGGGLGATLKTYEKMREASYVVNGSQAWIRLMGNEETVLTLTLAAVEPVDCEGDDYFLCQSGNTCINRSHVCDRFPDCIDKTDEFGCGSCGEGEMDCNDFFSRCLESKSLCNGNFDCPYNSGYDELNCGYCGPSLVELDPTRPVLLSSPSIAPNSGPVSCQWLLVATPGYKIVLRSISFALNTNNKVSIGTGNIPDPFTETIQQTKGVLPRAVLLDSHQGWIQFYVKQGSGSSQSNHLEFELTQFNQTVDCGEDEFLCAYGLQCVPQQSRCDTVRDCDDYSDELGCDDCPSSYFSCGDGVTCIQTNQICDIWVNCNNAIDEYDCYPFCGPSFVNLTAGEQTPIRLDVPSHFPYLCGWRAASKPGTSVCVDIVSMGYHYMHMLWLSSVADENAPTAFWLHSSDRLPVTTYFSRENRAYVWSVAFQAITVATVVEINFRVCEDAGVCNSNQVFFEDHTTCLSEEATCDGVADFPDFSDEMECDLCGPLYINASVDYPVSLIGEFGVAANWSSYVIQRGNETVQPPSETHDTDALRRYDCFWIAVAPAGARLEITITDMAQLDSGMGLKIGDGREPVGSNPLMEAWNEYDVPLREVLDWNQAWAVMANDREGVLERVRVVFQALLYVECSEDQFTCPTQTQCIDESQQCDSIVDCRDIGDELGCEDCLSEMFKCSPQERCIEKYQLCDLYADCNAANDQYQCTICGDPVISLSTNSPYSLDHRSKYEECVWIVTAPAGTRIRATFLYPVGCKLTFGDGAYGLHVNETAGFRSVSRLRGASLVDSVDGILNYPGSVSSPGSTVWLMKKWCRSPHNVLVYGVQVKLEAFEETVCLEGYRLCPSGSECIEQSAFCDGKVDCPEHGDEIGCGNCASNEFACLNSANCTLINNICDGIRDCPDRSDEYNCAPCGYTYYDLTDGTPVTIQSLDYPGYPPFLSCVYILRALPGYRVTVVFLDFSTENGMDIMRIGNGFEETEDIILEFTGNVFPSRVTSKGETMYLFFEADHAVQADGFSLRAQQMETEPDEGWCAQDEIQCDYDEIICVTEDMKELCPDSSCNYDVFTVDKLSVVFKSPNHPSTYPADLYCKWELSSPVKAAMTRVDVLAFSTEPNQDFLHLTGTDLLGDVYMNSLTGASTKVLSIVFNSTSVTARLQTDAYVQDTGFHLLLRNIEEPEPDWCADETTEFQCEDGTCLTASARCDGFRDCKHGDDEAECASVFCPNFYMCHLTQRCILWEYVCDGKVDCDQGDDERECETKRCPSDCKCTVMGDDLHVLCEDGWGPDHVGNIAGKTAALRLSGANIAVNRTTPLLQPGLFKGFPFLQSLSLPHNSLPEVPRGAFYGLQNLTYLNVSFNNFSEILEDTFSDLSTLEALVLTDESALEFIAENAFRGLVNVKTLVLTRNVEPFNYLQVENGAFSSLPHDVKTVVDDYRLCCNFLSDIPSFKITNCQTTQSQPPLNLCGFLMQNYGLRICIWVLGLSALLGNFAVIVWRFWHAEGKEVMKVHSFMVHNLAVSDFLMGVYMLIIAAADTHYGEIYSYRSQEWRSSMPCKAAGILSVLSSEASVFLVTLISIECFLNLVFPFSRFKLQPSSARIVVFVSWVVALFVSVVPTLVVNSESDIYGLSDVCIGLPLTTKATGVQLRPSDVDNPFGGTDTLKIVTSTSRKPAWILSIVVFLGVNLTCFLVVLACYIGIFIRVKVSERQVGKAAHRERDIRLAIKMLLIVGTDFACWMPVIVLGILSQTGAVDVGAEVYSWIVVLVLPINSSLNPYLYTIYSVMADRRQKTKQTSQKPLTDTKPKSKSVETVNSYLSDKNSREQAAT